MGPYGDVERVETEIGVEVEEEVCVEVNVEAEVDVLWKAIRQ